MKIHRNLSQAVIEALRHIFEEQKYADKAIERILQSNKKWGARDRGFIAETTYEIVRWHRRLVFVSGQDENQPIDYWTLLGTWLLLNNEELPDWQEFRNIDLQTIRQKAAQAVQIRKIREAIPDWLDQVGSDEIGQGWDEELSALNKVAPLVIRANTLKINRNKLSEILTREGITNSSIALSPDALLIEKRTNLFGLAAFREGLFEVQDAASQEVAPMLQVAEGMRVVDACAGAGGKTLHLSALMHNKGRIVSLDVEEWKLAELQKRARRAGAQNIETKLIASSKTIKRLYETADRLLLDVPCSGLGVIRRNPDAKWKIKPDFLETIRATQHEILSNYSKILRKSGKMVYATCSILPSESEKQVRRFLDENTADFELIDEKRLSPAKNGFDGFYMASLLRK